MANKDLVDGQFDFSGGVDSSRNPARLSDNQVFAAMNMTFRGGIGQTRPGLTSLFNLPCGSLQGLTTFTPTNSVPHIVWAVSGKVYVSPYPFDRYYRLSGIQFFRRSKHIAFASCVQTQTYDEDGFLQAVVPPKNVLIMQDANTRAAYWDGGASEHINPTLSQKFDEISGERVTQPGRDGTPIGLWSAWAGNRLWVSRGKEVFASDFGDPLKFTEREYLAEGRSFTMPENVTGMIQPASGDQLIVFGETTITFLRANILDRTLWLNTPDFQKSYYGLGCVSPMSIVNKLGLTWWFSRNGWTNFNFAQQQFNDSTIRYLDAQMAASKSYLSGDRSRVAAGSIENYMLVSVPSGDAENRHTWVQDLDPSAPHWDGVWTGIRPRAWASCVVEGVERIFCVSHDADGVNRLWEAFRPDRTDNGEPVTSWMVTRSHDMGTPANKMYRFTDIYAREILGVVDFGCYVGGKTGGWRNIFTQRIRAHKGPQTADTEYSETSPHTSNTVQSRRLTTQNTGIPDEDLCNGCGVEGEFIFPVDTEFSHLFVWSGRAGVMSYRMQVTVGDHDEWEGKCSEDEEEDVIRSVDSSGCSALSAVVTHRPLTTYTASATAEAECEGGGSVEATASSTSVISEQDAVRKAEGKARLLALGLLNCEEE